MFTNLSFINRLAEPNSQSARHNGGQFHGPSGQWSHRLQTCQAHWSWVQSGSAQWLTHACSRTHKGNSNPQWISNTTSNWAATDVEYSGKINTGTRWMIFWKCVQLLSITVFTIFEKHKDSFLYFTITTVQRGQIDFQYLSFFSFKIGGHF